MDLVQEKARLQALDEYGVKTTRQWNAYHAEWERQHPRLSIARRVGGNILLWAFTILYWAAILSPIIYYVKGLLNV